MALFKLLSFFFVLTQNLLVSLFLAFLLFGLNRQTSQKVEDFVGLDC